MSIINLNYNQSILKKSKKILSLLVLSLILLTSCIVDENGNPLVEPDGEALDQRFEDNRANAVQTFTLDAATGGTITGVHGTQITFPSSCTGNNGTPVTGTIEIQLIEIYTKADMVLLNMSTTGKKSNGDEEALKSGGEFFVSATQNGNPLTLLAPISIRTRNVDSSNFESMQVFRAGNEINDTDPWQEADENNDGQPDDAQIGEDQGPNGTYVLYSVFDMSSFGWTNLDKWYNFSGQLTDLFVDVPNGYNGDNIAVYLSYDGENGLARMDIYDETLGLFTEHYGRIPVGLDVHFIAITEINGIIHYAIQAATITNNHTEVITNLQPTTQADLTTLINNLP